MENSVYPDQLATSVSLERQDDQDLYCPHRMICPVSTGQGLLNNIIQKGCTSLNAKEIINFGMKSSVLYFGELHQFVIMMSEHLLVRVNKMSLIIILLDEFA